MGTPIRVVNKPGGGTILGATEVANSKPDGYTLGTARPPHHDDDLPRHRPRCDLQAHQLHPAGIVHERADRGRVRTGSPIKTLKDLVDAAKAKPGLFKWVTAGCSGQFTWPAWICKGPRDQVCRGPLRRRGARMVALLGGTSRPASSARATSSPSSTRGRVRVLAVLDRTEFKFLPGCQDGGGSGLQGRTAQCTTCCRARRRAPGRGRHPGGGLQEGRHCRGCQRRGSRQ